MNSKQNKNYFFASTGLQIINAIEYVHHAKLERQKNTLIVYNDDKFVRSEVQSVISYFNWNKIIFLPNTFFLNINNGHIRFLFFSIYNAFRIRLMSFKDTSIIGNDLNPYFRYATKSKGLKEIVFIDDGTGTVHYTGSNPYDTMIGVKARLLYRLLNIRHHKVVPNLFFCAFNLENYSPDPVANQKYIKHSFDYFSSLATNKSKKDVIYFIGDPLVTRGYLTLEKYLFIIEEVKRKFNKEIIYIPRFFEDEEIVNEVSKIVRVQRNDVPFELFIMKSEYLPTGIIGFHSSAIFNVHSIYGSIMEYHFIKMPNFKRQSHRETVAKMWLSMSTFATEFKPDYKLFLEQ